MALQDIPKKKTRPLDPKFNVEIKPARKKKATAKPMIKSAAKPKGLNDYLDKGMTPPSKNKKLPSDADVILKGYNDKKTIAKLKESKKKGKK
jgi:hypothetical protein